MKNFIQPGHTLDLTAPTGGLVSGQGIVIGAIFGVATTSAPEGKKVAVSVEGVFDLPKVTGTGLGEGTKVYWTGTAITSTVGSNTFVGHVVETASAPATIARVRVSQ